MRPYEKNVSRVILGAAAGISATLVMTIVMRRMHQLLPAVDRYSLPPREIVQQIALKSEMKEAALQDLTLLCHFVFGTATGALFAILPASRSVYSGVAYGMGVWVFSYLGWIPRFAILSPASRHPAPRNILMLVAHGIWGAVVAGSLYELEQSKQDIFGGGRLRDAAT
jgi:uncharacterized membrane protein YagU involved in acid resistance